MKIAIVRHAAMNPVTEEMGAIGRSQAARAGKYLSCELYEPLRILTSPWERAIKTAQIIATVSGINPPIEENALLSLGVEHENDGLERLYAFIGELVTSEGSVVLVSHLDTVGYLIRYTAFQLELQVTEDDCLLHNGECVVFNTEKKTIQRMD